MNYNGDPVILEQLAQARREAAETVTAAAPSPFNAPHTPVNPTGMASPFNSPADTDLAADAQMHEDLEGEGPETQKGVHLFTTEGGNNPSLAEVKAFIETIPAALRTAVAEVITKGDEPNPEEEYAQQRAAELKERAPRTAGLLQRRQTEANLQGRRKAESVMADKFGCEAPERRPEASNRSGASNSPSSQVPPDEGAAEELNTQPDPQPEQQQPA